MSEFKTITIESQEQLDAMFKERIDRAKKTTEEKIREEYAGFDDFKSKAEKYDQDIADINAKLEEANAANESDKSIIEDLNKKIKSYEIASVKAKICNEFGLSHELASRINGEDEESIRADAQALQQIVGTIKTAPLASTEPDGGDTKTAALKGMLSNLNLE